MGKRWEIFSRFLLGCLVALGLLIVISRTLGYQFLVVLSGSMEPTIPVGSLIVVAPRALEQLSVDDVVTFKSQHNQGTVVTHRVKKLDQNQQWVMTQGDGNEQLDSQPVTKDQLIGKVTISLPALGYLVTWLKSKISLLLLLIFSLISLGHVIWRKLINPPKSPGLQNG